VMGQDVQCEAPTALGAIDDGRAAVAVLPVVHHEIILDSIPDSVEKQRVTTDAGELHGTSMLNC
jgi:hypothetical protein